MAQRVGRCTNSPDCELAYRNEKITVVSNDFRCPRCRSSLTRIGATKHDLATLYVLIGIGLAVLPAVGAIVWILINIPQPRILLLEESSTPAPSSNTGGAAPMASAITETPTPITTVEPVATPLNFDTVNPEIAAVRREVLRRIERSPYPQAQKDRAYELVDKAHGLGRLFTVSFKSGGMRLLSREIRLVKSAVVQEQIKKVLDDPTVVLVILGFADRQGDYVSNQQLSQGRAQAVLDVLRGKAGVLNVMYPIAMGGTDLFDLNDFSKNRIVEVWAVLP
jgi:outer membrane protein OmpA-like peptidoglycan-associated protein